MASRKTELKKHLDYLQARRSGAEYCKDLVKSSDDRELINTFVHNLGKSIQETSIEIAKIENEEAEKKAEEKAEKERLKRERMGTY